MKKIIYEQQKLLDLKAKEIENLASVKKKDKFVPGEGSGKGTEVKVPSTVLRKDLKISRKIGNFGKKRRFNVFHKSCSPSRKYSKGWL